MCCLCKNKPIHYNKLKHNLAGCSRIIASPWSPRRQCFELILKHFQPLCLDRDLLEILPLKFDFWLLWMNTAWDLNVSISQATVQLSKLGRKWIWFLANDVLPVINATFEGRWSKVLMKSGKIKVVLWPNPFFFFGWLFKLFWNQRSLVGLRNEAQLLQVCQHKWMACR